MTSTIPDFDFGYGGRRLAQNGAGDLLGVETVGLAVHPPRNTVGPVDLDDVFTRSGQRPGQGRAKRPGALHANCADRSLAAHPAQQHPVAAIGGWELLMTEQSAVLVDDRRIAGVLVDTAIQ